jgi:hypothetical protein
MHDPKAHAKVLLELFEDYCKRQPASAANQRGLKCARELVRLLEIDNPDKRKIETLYEELEDFPPDAGSAWMDLQITARGCFKEE